MFERFTTAARDVVVRARDEAQGLRHPYIGTEHLLLALLGDDTGVAYAVLHDAGLDASRVRADVVRLVGTPSKLLTDEDAEALKTVGIDLDRITARIEEIFGPDALEAPAPRRRRRDGSRFSARAKKVLQLALREAIRLGHRSIGTEHILLGLLREGEGLAARVLVDAGLSISDLRRATEDALRKAA
jgi:ATP-dependent Clp protease ATP-binding subunit ClpA